MTRAECIRRAHAAARGVGFAIARSLKAHVIGRGWRKGDDLHAFNRAQAVWLHVACCLLWASTSDAGERARWVRLAHKGAFFTWLAYEPRTVTA